MCGFVGFFGVPKSNIQSIDKLNDRLRWCLDNLKHRGPDACGIFLSTDQSFGLAHARLRVVDDDPASDQPFKWKSYAAVYNGEIYNFLDLKKNLEDLGHDFKGSSDTEVILHAFDEWGDQAFSMFNGMFAIALANKFDNTLRLVRDTSGIKPLYYRELDTKVFFGSTVISVQDIDNENEYALNWDGISSAIKFGAPLLNSTCFSKILSVEPGHIYKYLLEDGVHLKPSIHPFSFVEKNKQVHTTVQMTSVTHLGVGDSKQLAQTINDLLDDVLKDQLFGVGNPAVFFSGGLDSTLIAARLSQMRSFDPTYYFCKVQGVDAGEKVAETVARHLNFDLNIVEFKPKNLMEEAEKILKISDFPVTDLAIFSLSYLSSIARRRHKFGLVGDGGDELFAGYNRYWRLQAIDNFAHLIPLVPKRVLDVLPNKVARYLSVYRRRGVFDYGCVMSQAYLENIPSDVFSSNTLESMRTAESIFTKLSNSNLRDNNRISQMLQIDRMHLLRNVYLPKSDIGGMANGFELRVPLLDERIKNLSGYVSTKDMGGLFQTKKPFRDALLEFVPKSVWSHPKKGFEVSGETLFPRDQIIVRIESALDCSLVREVFNVSSVKKLLQKQKEFSGASIFKLYLIMRWLQLQENRA